MPKIDAFLKIVVEQGASDLHLVSNASPILRVNGDLVPIKFRTISDADAWKLFDEIIPSDRLRQYYLEHHDVDFAYHIPGVGRFRVNLYYDRNGVAGAFRLIPERIHTLEELDLPLALEYFAHLERGLVLVTGPTGSGKSTTLAAIIDIINNNYSKHVVTIEDPIEFVHNPKKSFISMRELGTHTHTFAAALKSALREAADVILVGEMRDLETISLAVTCAETGALVFGTLHTNSAAKTIDRLIDVFPSDRQEQMRVMLSMSLQGVVAQQLLKTADGKGRVAAVEILKGSFALANLIREAKSYQINSLIQSTDYETTGMISMDQYLRRLVEKGKVTVEEARKKAIDKTRFMAELSQ